MVAFTLSAHPVSHCFLYSIELSEVMKYAGAGEFDLDINEVHGRLAPVKFAVEASDDDVHISGLDEFEIDLNNGIYSMSECMALMHVLDQLMQLELK